ncbi:hypothetical protein [Francisella orientalis]|uniref:hypothetical protein n=1 Tax=Francisella orientalis TaxID=299583 RepID=UPI00025D4DA9|nr:hypothetical protein [Francisella orientalis]AFJ43908.1 unknown function [Francisella orientalis str. Toba 04]
MLELEDETLIYNIVVFVGSATFKTNMPENVFKIFRLRNYLKQQNLDKLSYSQVYQE